MGMASPGTNQAKLNFRYSVTSSSDEYSWHSGSVLHESVFFRLEIQRYVANRDTITV